MLEIIMDYSQFYDFTPEQIRAEEEKHPMTTSQAQFSETLRQLGVHPGMKLVVHSSLASLGKFEGGAEGYCRVLMKEVTEDGTLMMPGLSKYPNDGEECFFDPRTTPCRVGAVPDFFRSMPGVVRSWDPTHSMCVWGKDREFYVRNHHKLPTMHGDSPLGLLEKAGGYCLMVGCHRMVTFMHVVETACKCHCLGSRTESYPANLPGVGNVTLRGWGWRKGACPALRHDEIFGYLRENNLVREVMLAHSHILLFRLSDYRTAYSRLLTAPEGGCATCTILPRQVQRSVPTDWDWENNCLKKPSEAFTGEWVPNP